jgi:hypothetical protein
MDSLFLDRPPEAAVSDSWWAFLRRVEFPTHNVSPEYLLEPGAKDKGFMAILAMDQDHVLGVLTGAQYRGHVECGLDTRPQFVCDRDSDADAVAGVLASALVRRMYRKGLFTVHAWQPLTALRHLGFREFLRPDAIVMLDLTKGPDQLLKETAGVCRTAIRKAIKNGVDVREATTREDILAHYRIREDWSTRKHLPFESYDHEQTMGYLAHGRRIFVAVHDGQVIASSVVRFCKGGVVEYTSNSSIRDKMILKPNDLLQWRIIEWACREGFTRYSLAGAHHFLRKFGGELIPTYRYRLDRTFFRRHDARERLAGWGRRAFRALPLRVQSGVRTALRRDAARPSDNDRGKTEKQV